MINIRSSREIEQLRKANAIVAEVFQRLREKVVPDITTKDLDQIAEAFILSQGAIPAFKGYRGFPATLCVSINEEVVHGIPGSAITKKYYRSRRTEQAWSFGHCGSILRNSGILNLLLGCMKIW